MAAKSHVHQGTWILRLIAFGICLCTMSLQGMAQDDMLGSDGGESQFKAENFGFNAINLRQSRFLYGDSAEYSNKTFLDHMSLGMVWHYERMDDRIPRGYDAALNYGLFVEKELSKEHALRLLFYKGAYFRSVRPIRMDKYQLELLHSFSWTRYFGGYNPNRRLEATTNLGVGAFYSTRSDDVRLGPMFVMGAGARIRLSPQISLGIDPYVSFVGDSVGYSGDMPHRKYNILYGADVSLSYTFPQKVVGVNGNLYRHYQGNTFVDFALGIQFEPYVESQLPSDALPFFATPGPQLKFGVGRWIRPGVALRAAAGLSSSNWDSERIEANLLTNHQAYDIKLKNVLANGRLDLLFSLTGRTDRPFGINAIVGWERGWMIKTAYNPVDLLKTYYDGPSGGLQLQYKCDRYTALYVEPRLTWANYSVPYAMPYDKYEKRCRDYLFSMVVGLEFGVNDSLSFKRLRRQPSKFRPNYSLSLQGGSDYMFVTKEYAGDFYMDYSVGVAGEVQMTPYSGGRVMVGWSQLSNRDVYAYQQRLLEDEHILLSDTALCTGKYGFVNLSADYVFDLGQLLQGYNESSRWDAAFAVGLVYSRRVRVKTVVSKEEMLWEFRGDNPIATVPVIDHSRVAEHAVGLQLGIPVSYRLDSHWNLLFEPRARFFPRDYVARPHYRGGTKILAAQLGVKYTF